MLRKKELTVATIMKLAAALAVFLLTIWGMWICFLTALKPWGRRNLEFCSSLVLTFSDGVFLDWNRIGFTFHT